MALEGSLRDFDLFSLFNMIKTQGKSGTLVLSRGQEFVKVYFDQGDIAGCDSNQVRMEDRLGAMLVRLGRLSGDELLLMIQRQRQTLKRMGTLLLESGKVSAQDLQDALFNQAMSIIYRTFRWVEGDYRFDSMLPMDLDRETFPAIPVDTVLMEAARIMDEWPEVQRRLPYHALPLEKTSKALALKLELDHETSSVFEGRKDAHWERSGLSHEQETVLTYFSEPQSIASALQITRYDELETCKTIAELIEMGLLAISQAEFPAPAPAPWAIPAEINQEPKEPFRPSALLWPLVALFIAAPALLYVPRSKASVNFGMNALVPPDLRIVNDPVTRDRQAWAQRMASGNPRAAGEGGTAPDLAALPDPLRAPLPDLPKPQPE